MIVPGFVAKRNYVKRGYVRSAAIGEGRYSLEVIDGEVAAGPPGSEPTEFGVRR